MFFVYRAYSGCVLFGLQFALSYVIPLIIVSVLLSDATQTAANNPTCATGNTDAAAGGRRATTLVVVVVIVFAILWLPHLVHTHAHIRF